MSSISDKYRNKQNKILPYGNDVDALSWYRSQAAALAIVSKPTKGADSPPWTKSAQAPGICMETFWNLQMQKKNYIS